jgi:hypothetical protein
MSKPSYYILTLIIAFLSYSKQVIADDIEIYVNSLLNNTEKPRVMLLFDTSIDMNGSSKTGHRCVQKDIEWCRPSSDDGTCYQK